MLSKKPRANQCFRKFVHFGVAAQPTRTVPKLNSSSNRRDAGRRFSVGGPLTMDPRSAIPSLCITPTETRDSRFLPLFPVGLGLRAGYPESWCRKGKRRGPHGAGLETPVKCSWSMVSRNDHLHPGFHHLHGYPRRNHPGSRRSFRHGSLRISRDCSDVRSKDGKMSS